MPTYKLTYFDVRARGEPIRMMFALADVPFEDHRIQIPDWPELKKKTPGGLLPVLEVDGKPLPQTLAILRYLANEFGFHGKTSLDQAMVDAYADQVMDLTVELTSFYKVQLGYEKGDLEKLHREVYQAACDKHFPIINRALEQNPSGFLVGQSLAYADVVSACMIQVIRDSVPEEKDSMLNDFPAIKAHIEKVFAVPRIAKYIEGRPENRY